jgi:uncharacterized protein
LSDGFLLEIPDGILNGPVGGVVLATGGAGMLRVDVHILERQDVVLDREGLPKALGLKLDEGMIRGPLAVHAEITKSGDSFLMRGWVSGLLRATCDLCLRSFEAPFKSFFETHYREREDGGAGEGKQELELELTGDETDIVPFDGILIDLTDEIRQAVVLAVPMRALCREDCRGLCAGCGADLNRESCRCPDPPRDSRWSALKDFKPVR